MKCVLLLLFVAAALGQSYINRCVKDKMVHFPDCNDLERDNDPENAERHDVHLLCSWCQTQYENYNVYYKSNVGDRECVSALEETGFRAITISGGIEAATCIPPYYPIGPLCLRNHISHCRSYSKTSIRCNTCETGYGLANHGKSCKKCASKCSDCSSSYKQCVGCIYGYRISLNSNKCLKCSVGHCQRCELDIDLCDVGYCAEGYQISRDLRKCYKCSVSNCTVCEQDEGDTCVTCKEGYRLEDAKCKKCKVSGCGTCHDNVEECDLCKRDYLLVDSKTCSKCTVENCSMCEPGNPQRCRACSEGFQKKDGGLTCGVCEIANCDICDPADLDRCASCEDYYSVNNNGKCEQLKCEGEYCTCTTLSSDCTGCESGYMKVTGNNTRCYKRPFNNCTSATLLLDEVICSGCAEGYYLKSDGKDCIKCDDQSGLNRSVNCRACTESILYEAGEDNLVHQSTEAVCTGCLDGFGFDRTYGVCIPCIENCLHCDFAARCFDCNAGYVLQPNHTCKRRLSAGANGLVTAFFALLLVVMF